MNTPNYGRVTAPKETLEALGLPTHDEPKHDEPERNSEGGVFKTKDDLHNYLRAMLVKAHEAGAGRIIGKCVEELHQATDGDISQMVLPMMVSIIGNYHGTAKADSDFPGMKVAAISLDEAWDFVHMETIAAVYGE